MATNITRQLKGLSQCDLRIGITLHDQHKSSRFPSGRPWWGFTERAIESAPNGGHAQPGTVGGVYPGVYGDINSGWTAPWMPPEKYFRMDFNGRKLIIDYSSLIFDQRKAIEEYYEAIQKKAFDNGWEVPEFLGPIESRLSDVIGPRPADPRIAEAALAGDPWILGLTQEPNEKLAELLRSNVKTIRERKWEEYNAPVLATMSKKGSKKVESAKESTQNGPV